MAADLLPPQRLETSDGRSLRALSFSAAAGMRPQAARAGSKATVPDIEEVPGRHAHAYQPREVKSIRTDLLAWYGRVARDLPWRAQSAVSVNERAYGIWVSEIMLQQTRVATVVDYWKRCRLSPVSGVHRS
jgi:A/G-specific adenine glycosylase